MEARHRERSRSIVTGNVTNPGPSGAVISASGSKVFEIHETDDFWKKTRRLYDPTGSGLPPSDFSSYRVHRKWTPFNGGTSGTGNWYHNYPVGRATGLSANHLSQPAGKNKNDDFYVARLLARSNPMRTTFSVPVFIRELAEVAAMFALNAKTFASFIGGNYLNYQFGWLTFVDDIKTLASIVKDVNSRVKEFNSILQQGGIRRNVRLDSYGAKLTDPSVIIHSVFGHTLYAAETVSSKFEVWGSVRWYPTNYQLIPTDPADAWLLAVRQVFDLEMIDSETAWNLIPWSWLVDYFTNIGDIFAANEGRWLVTPRDICIMRLTTSVYEGKRLRLNNNTDKIVGGDYRVTRTTKYRNSTSTSDVTAQAHGSFLTFSQYKVLLALAAKFG